MLCTALPILVLVDVRVLRNGVDGKGRREDIPFAFGILPTLLLCVLDVEIFLRMFFFTKVYFFFVMRRVYR